jgi:hypothetical protein
MSVRSEYWRRLARAAARMYPRDWQARYGREMQALIDESDVRVWTIVDILAAAIVEQGRSAWTTIFVNRRPMYELASIAVSSLVSYWVFFRLLIDVDGGPMAPDAWMPANLLRLALLVLRTYVVVTLGLAMIAGLNRRFGDRAERWWIRGIERLLALAALILLDELGSLRLHWWQSAEDLRAVYGQLSMMVLFVTFFQLEDPDHYRWSDIWRRIRSLARRPADPDKTL